MSQYRTHKSHSWRDIKFVSPDTPSKCTWKLVGNKSPSPHDIKTLEDKKKLLPDILCAIGHTPIVKLNKIPQSLGITCDMYVKCEFMNPGGSVKDRIGYRMIEDAEKKGLLKPGSVVIEASSGNTGIALAMACAIKGYKCIIVMPEKMSDEKVDILKAFGAEIVRTPTEASSFSPDGLIKVAHRLNKEIPNSIVLDQYRNCANPLAHYDGTASEILDAFDGKVDMIVGGAGTGGTLTGIGRKLKERCPTCLVVGADPVGSILSVPAELNKTDVKFYEIEGIGYDFVPTVLDRSIVDMWVKSTDKESFLLSKRLIREEGILCGGSSGTAMSGALKAAKKLKAGQKCVVILPDGVRNYMSRFVTDNWMEARDFQDTADQDHWWWTLPATNIIKQPPKPIYSSMTCSDGLKLLTSEKVSQLPIVDENGFLKGMFTQNYLMIRIVNKRANFNDSADNALFKQFRRVEHDTPLGRVSRILEKEPFVAVVKKQPGGDKYCDIITNIDLLNMMCDALLSEKMKSLSTKMKIIS